MEYVNCSLCGANAAQPLYTLPDLLLARPNTSATLVRCGECGLIYQNPRPTLAEMEFHYPAEYEPYAPEPDGAHNPWLDGRAVQFGIDKRVRFVTRRKNSGRLLDVGCAGGVFLAGMQRTGKWCVAGVEFNQAVARAAHERYGMEVRAGTLEQAAFENESFDVVTLWDVFEHLHEPAASLQEIHRILRPDGVLILRVPNAGSWDARLFGRYWAGLDAPRHLYVFTPTTLHALLLANRFEPASWSTSIGAYTTFLLSLRFWKNAMVPRSKLGTSVIQALYHPLARLLLAPFFFFSGMFKRGPLMVVTAEKKVEPAA